MDKRLGLGASPISKIEFEMGRGGVLRRLFLLVLAIVILGIVFMYVTGEIQSSTAHATQTGVHWEPSSQ